MNTTAMADTTQQDQSAVAAVRNGDAERYRELVERHERRVFAVAWSRLGDAALAEDVTQEAFIRGYRRLWLLGDGAKFAGWITSIARNTAINFGLRHRRELNKRERWALEQVSETGSPDVFKNESPHSPETLRQAVAELPAPHRECLVLFYLEGKSGAEAATALGISEATLRVRLHRARAALRERLEEKLERSLAQLRPSKPLVPVVMAVVMASTSAKAATVGAVVVGAGSKITSVIGKTFLFAWLAPLMMILGNIPGLIAVFFIMRKERENFRDADGFRPQLHRHFLRSFIWGFPLLLVGFAVFNQSAVIAWGIGTHQVVLAGLVSVLTLISARSAVICRNPYQLSQLAYCLIIAAGLSALALGWIPPGLAQLPLLSATVVLFLFYKKRPLRMDYSLFLRAGHELLKISDTANYELLPHRFKRPDLLAFARFLGSRFLVTNYQWEDGGLALRLPPVRNRFLTKMAMVFMPPITRRCSHVLLGWNGTVRAHCSEEDAQNIAVLKTSRLANPRELENLVASSLFQAWQEFRIGKLPEAERSLGESPESEVFVAPPARAKSMRWWRILIGTSIALMVAGMSIQFLPAAWMAKSNGMKPVFITDTQAHTFFSLISTNPNPLVTNTVNGRELLTRNGSEWEPSLALFTCLVLPETNLLPASAIQAIRDSVAGGDGFEAWRQSPYRVQSVNSSGLPRRALTCGWIDWRDLNLRPSDLRDHLHASTSYSREHWDVLLTRYSSWSWVKSERHEVLRIGADGLTQLRLWLDADYLNLLDRERLITHIASVQALSVPPPGQPPIHDLKSVRGLFFTPGSPVLQDTCFSLAALEILGGLDRIDREACVRGILRRHAGRGFFRSPSSGGFNEYHIDGSAQDTIAAYESLRILGALDRVKDLNRWQFRVNRRRLAPHEVTWRDIEAWVATKRLARILQERARNPAAPFRSLLEP